MIASVYYNLSKIAEKPSHIIPNITENPENSDNNFSLQLKNP
jgi:hypothetical protein